MFEREVDEAVRWLDRVNPGWHNRINMRRFDIASNRFCVLGQLELFPSVQNAQEHYRAFGISIETLIKRKELNQAWKQVIRRRTGLRTRFKRFWGSLIHKMYFRL